MQLWGEAGGMLVLAALTASLLRPAWSAAPPASLESPVWRNAVHERFQNTDVYLLEDGKQLFVAFAAAQGGGTGDAVSLYLWSDKAAYRFSVDENGVRSATCSTGGVPRWSARETAQNGGYQVVLRLPQALFSGGGSRWLVQFAREFAGGAVSTWPASSGAAGNVMHATAFAPTAPGTFSTAASQREPKVLPAAQAQQLWPGGVAPVAPQIPADAQGVALAQSQDHFKFAGVDAKGKDGTQQDAQSLAWLSPDGHTTAGVSRVASNDGSTYDETQTLALAYDNAQNLRVSAGISADRGSNVDDATQANYGYYDFSLYGDRGSFEMQWNSVGPQFNADTENAPAPGTTGYTLTATRRLGNVSVDASANRYRDDLGNLADANERAAISAALSPQLTFDVSAASNAATQYTTLPFAQSGAALAYAAGSAQARFSYHQDRYAGGVAQELAISGGVTMPLLGTLQFAHRQTEVSGTFSSLEPAQSTSASILHRLPGGSISIGYQYAPGAANMTFSFDDRLPIGLLRATYYKPNTLFSAPNFSLKLISL